MSVEILDTAKDMIYQLQNRKPALQDCPDYLFSILNGNKNGKMKVLIGNTQSVPPEFLNNHLRGLAKALHLTSPVTFIPFAIRGLPLRNIAEFLLK